MIETLRTFLFESTAGIAVLTLAGLVLIRFLALGLHRVLERRMTGVDRRTRLPKLTNLITYLLWAVFLIVMFYRDLRDLTVALGVFGAGVAFALQEVITSLAGWFAISFAGFYQVGDRVQVGGIKGDVIDIGFLRTTLMEIGEWVRGDNYNGRIVRVANSFIFKEPVFNYSQDFHYLWDEITIPIKYGSNYELARMIMEKVAYGVVGDNIPKAREEWKALSNKYIVEDAPIEPMIAMYATENWLEFTLRYVVHYRVRRRTKDKIFTRILEEFEKAGEKIDIGAPTLQILNPEENQPRRRFDDESDLR